MEITQQRATVRDLDFAYLTCGEGPLALLWHGFPDTPNGWRPLMTALADAGYRAVAPWARGYAPTAVPADGGSPIAAWVDDAIGFHEAFGGDEPAVLIGHDWGALMAYGAAGYAPERWRKLVVASVPPPAVIAAKLTQYDQVKSFWYQYVFLQPTAEGIVAADDLEFIRRLWGDWSPGYDASDDIGAVIEALREPAHLTAALHTYRSMYDMGLIPPQLIDRAMAVMTPPTQPTLYLHGASDGCVPGDPTAEVASVLAPGSSTRLLDGAGHFLQYEQPKVVTDLVLDFLAD